ncbi:hypothetical protein [Streptomyces sp. ISL-94]|uniref:hypothetical protein n=1 Tax=Streptomyces sp. ISL-94 TaxID=2819190 RepID=UPI001BEBBD56|nr:hypothetical protein [Streptomyces sp. ISL-94]MBT2478365.1 hypothetical protein [Streptomyces sp. ISL-94]
MSVVDQAPTSSDMRHDSSTAMTLAALATATGPAASDLRVRLRGYITLLADPAQEYADALTPPGPGR